MGTRSTLKIKDEGGRDLLMIYRQFDGYPEGMGKDIIEFIRNGKLSDGYRHGDKAGQVFNGMGDLVCQLIAHFKRPKKDPITGKKVSTPGNFYVVSLDEHEEGYHYELGVRRDAKGKNEIYLTCRGHFEEGDSDYVNKTEELFPLTLENTKYTKTVLFPKKKEKKN